MKKVLSFAMIALTLGYVFVSCDEEKLTPEEEKPVVNNDSIPSNPTDSTQTTPADSTQTTPADSVASYTLAMNVETPDYVYLGTDKSNSYGDSSYLYYRQDIVIDKFILTHSFTDYGMGEAFTYTNCANDTTPGYMNLSAITKGGVESNTYFTVNTGGYGLSAEISFADSAAYNVKECYVTNSTYAYLAIRDRNDGNPRPYVKEWESGDWFALTITGYYNDEVTNSKIVVLASGKDDILNTWQKVDLSSLGKVQKIRFTLDSSDTTVYGPVSYMNTPAYFCLDQLTVTE